MMLVLLIVARAIVSLQSGPLSYLAPPHLQSQMMMLVPVLMHFVSARMRTPYLSAVPVAPFLSLTLIAQGAR
jgi:hypothetical protein